jgi:hypothetical protein
MRDRPAILYLSKIKDEPMQTIYLETDEDSTQVRLLVESAINREIAHLEIARSLARKRLAPFEQAYHVTSEQFLAEMTAEDLHGGDDEYVQWAGEYRLLCRLDEQLQQLRGIRYRD